MNKKDVIGLASMPLQSPTYPRGPYKFFNRQYLVIRYKTDADAIRAHLPQAILAESAFVGAVSELLDDLAPTVPEATRLPLIGVGGGDVSARLQALVGGADLFIARLDDPTLAAQVRELLATQNIEPFRVLVVDDDRQMGT